MYYIKKYIALILTASTILVCCSCKKKSKIDYKDVNDLFNDIVNELQTNYEDYQDCWEGGSLEMDSFVGKKVSFKVLEENGFYFEGGKLKGVTKGQGVCPYNEYLGVPVYFVLTITNGEQNATGKPMRDSSFKLQDGSVIKGTIMHIEGDCIYDSNDLSKLSKGTICIYIIPD